MGSYPPQQYVKRGAKLYRNMFRKAGAGGGGGSFSPSDISDMVFWHDASDSSTITKDGSNRVSQIDDKSGNSRHLVQSTGSSQPLWVSADRNGLDVINYSGGTYDMAHSSFTAVSQPLTIFAVMQAPTAGQAFIDGIVSTNRTTIHCGGSTNNFRINAGTTLNGGTSIGGNWCYGNAIYNGNSSSLDFTDGTNTETLSGNAGTQSTTGIIMGRFFVTSDWYSKKFAEIIMYSKAVSGDELTNCRNYLKDKWGF